MTPIDRSLSVQPPPQSPITDVEKSPLLNNILNVSNILKNPLSPVKDRQDANRSFKDLQKNFTRRLFENGHVTPVSIKKVEEEMLKVQELLNKFSSRADRQFSLENSSKEKSALQVKSEIQTPTKEEDQEEELQPGSMRSSPVKLDQEDDGLKPKNVSSSPVKFDQEKDGLEPGSVAPSPIKIDQELETTPQPENDDCLEPESRAFSNLLFTPKIKGHSPTEEWEEEFEQLQESYSKELAESESEKPEEGYSKELAKYDEEIDLKILAESESEKPKKQEAVKTPRLSHRGSLLETIREERLRNTPKAAPSTPPKLSRRRSEVPSPSKTLITPQDKPSVPPKPRRSSSISSTSKRSRTPRASNKKVDPKPIVDPEKANALSLKLVQAIKSGDKSKCDSLIEEGARVEITHVNYAMRFKNGAITGLMIRHSSTYKV